MRCLNGSFLSSPFWWGFFLYHSDIFKTVESHRRSPSYGLPSCIHWDIFSKPRKKLQNGYPPLQITRNLYSNMGSKSNVRDGQGCLNTPQTAVDLHCKFSHSHCTSMMVDSRRKEKQNGMTLLCYTVNVYRLHIENGSSWDFASVTSRTAAHLCCIGNT